MPLPRWKRLTRTVVLRNRWWTYCKDEYELPSGGRGEYHSVHTNGASLIVPVADDGRIILVNQFRYLCDRESIELPCGGVKDGSSHNETAWQELREETGYTSDRMFLAGEFNPYNGVTDEICKVYVARELIHVGGDPDETEEFELVRLAPGELDGKIASGEIWDGMTIAGWTIAKPKLHAGGPE